MVAWLWWILKGRPYIRVEMSSDWMKAAGFPCPEVEHFDAPAYKYAKVMRVCRRGRCVNLNGGLLNRRHQAKEQCKRRTSHETLLGNHR